MSPTLADHEFQWATELIGESSSAPPELRVLDISAGDGSLLRKLTLVQGPFHVELRGFERDPDLAAAGTNDGIPMELGAFDHGAARRLVADGWLADLVLVNHALAHFEDPDALIGAILDVLAPGGVVAIETHHLLGIVRGGQFDAISHAHSLYPSLGTLRIMFESHGLEIVEARQVDAYGGSLRLAVMRQGDLNGTASVRSPTRLLELLSEEEAADLTNEEVLRGLQSEAHKRTADLHDFLVARCDAGEIVLGYGAPARGVVLLNLAGVDASLLRFTVDRNVSKQGRALAGSRIVVRPVAALEAARPDYVLVLPWTLVSEISEQLASLRVFGSRFVVAMPELRVLDA